MPKITVDIEWDARDDPGGWLTPDYIEDMLAEFNPNMVFEVHEAANWAPAWKAYARRAREFANECHAAGMQHEAIHLELYRELLNRLVAGYQMENGQWAYKCLVCDARGTNAYSMGHSEDCPLSIPDNIRKLEK